MDLIKALKQASKIVPKGKKTALQFIRFCSASEKLSAHVYGSDGDNFIVVFVEDCLPDALIPVEALRPLVKTGGVVQVESKGYGAIEFHTDEGITKAQSEDWDNFPVLPPFPELTQVLDAVEARKVVHAAGTEKLEPQFAVVSFAPDWIEAYSGSRYARVLAENQWTGLVSSKLFKAWPKGRTVQGSDGNHAFFRIGDTEDKVGDEIRIGALQRQHYPDTEQGIPREHEGARVVVDTKAFKAAVEASISVGASNFMRVIFGEGVTVYPFGAENRKGKEELCDYSNSYRAAIPIQYSFGEPVNQCTLNLNGKYVFEALKQVKTRNVILGYGEDGNNYQPLRVESGGYTACVWQLVL